MAISTRKWDGVAILDVTRVFSVSASRGDPDLRAATTAAIRAGEKKVLLNLKGLTDINPEGLTELERCRVIVGSQGGRLKFVAAPGTWDMSVLNDYLRVNGEVFETEDAALKSFA